MAELGNIRRVYLGATSSGSTTYTWLTGEQSNSINRSNSLVEVSDKSDGWQKFIGGIKGATAEVTVFADDSNAQQTAVLDALEDGTEVAVFIGKLGTGGSPEEGDAFMALVGSVSDTNDNGSVASRSISLTATGEVTRY